MDKGWKFALYILLILLIIAVIWLMFGNTNPNVEVLDENTKVSTGDEVKDTGSNNTVNYKNTDTFEEDVMKDLEGFFGNSNGYENVEGEFGFTNIEAE